MGNKRNKCCCECPYNCLLHGESHTPCDTDTSRGYSVSGLVCPSGATQCCFPPSLLLTRETTGAVCEWNSEGGIGDECGVWTLAIGGGTAKIKLVVHNTLEVFIWKSPAPYNPLCSARFWLDLDDPDYYNPSGCKVCEYLCVQPHNGCCDDAREEVMPDTLYATYTYCCGTQEGLTIDFSLAWNASSRKWEGSVTIPCAGHLFGIKFFCNPGEWAGCASPTAYEYTAEQYLDGVFYDSTSVARDCMCDPFQITFDLADLRLEHNCPAEVNAGGQLVITE